MSAPFCQLAKTHIGENQIPCYQLRWLYAGAIHIKLHFTPTLTPTPTTKPILTVGNHLSW